MIPLISVIIPTYKNIGGLKDSIDSVLKQSYSNIEIIIVDDNNVDEYREATKKLMLGYQSIPSIKYIKHEFNKNGAAARNTGINVSKGEYIAFLDDDDKFNTNKLEEQFNYIENSDYDCVYCHNVNYGKQSIIKGKIEGDLSRELLLLKSQLLTPTLLFSRQSILDLNGFDENFKRHQDYEIMLRFFEKGYKVGFVKTTYTILGNQGQNRIFGRKMLEIKDSFINQFSHTINSMNVKESGFKNKVYAKHYTNTFIALIKGKEYRLAINVFNIHLKNKPILFLRNFVSYLVKFLSIKIG